MKMDSTTAITVSHEQEVNSNHKFETGNNDVQNISDGSLPFKKRRFLTTDHTDIKELAQCLLSQGYHLHVQADGNVEVHEGELQLEMNFDQQLTKPVLEMMSKSQPNVEHKCKAPNEVQNEVVTEAELSLEVGWVSEEDKEFDSMDVSEAIDKFLDEVKASTSKTKKQEETTVKEETKRMSIEKADNISMYSDISDEPLVFSDEEAPFEDHTTKDLIKEPTIKYNDDGAIGELITAADISIDNLVYDENQKSKEMKTSIKDPKEIEEITQVLRWRSERAVLLSCSHSLGIYPEIEEDGIQKSLEDLVAKFSHKNILVDKEITNMALIISTLFYLIHKSSQFAVRSITIAAMSLASEQCGKEFDWNLILTDEQIMNISSHEFSIQKLLRNHIKCVVDPVKHVEKLWQNDTKVTKGMRKHAKLHAQKCLQDRFLVQTQIPTDIARLSLMRAVMYAL